MMSILGFYSWQLKKDTIFGAAQTNIWPFLFCKSFRFTLSAFNSFEWTPRQAICIKHFLLFPQRICRQRKQRQTKHLLLNFWIIELTKTTILTNYQVPNGFFVYNCKFYQSKIESKHLVCLSFLWWQVFLREREKIFYTYSRP